jgi:hypothetical protein
LVLRQRHENLVPFHHPLPHGRGLQVETVQAIDKLLLLAWGQARKTWLAPQCLLLLLQALAAMLGVPLGQVLAAASPEAWDAGTKTVTTRAALKLRARPLKSAGTLRSGLPVTFAMLRPGGKREESRTCEASGERQSARKVGALYALPRCEPRRCSPSPHAGIFPLPWNL